jgi:hypothetical protein
MAGPRWTTRWLLRPSVDRLLDGALRVGSVNVGSPGPVITRQASGALRRRPWFLTQCVSAEIRWVHPATPPSVDLGPVEREALLEGSVSFRLFMACRNSGRRPTPRFPASDRRQATAPWEWPISIARLPRKARLFMAYRNSGSPGGLWIKLPPAQTASISPEGAAVRHVGEDSEESSDDESCEGPTHRTCSVLHLGIGRDISRHNEAPPTYSRATGRRRSSLP